MLITLKSESKVEQHVNSLLVKFQSNITIRLRSILDTVKLIDKWQIFLFNSYINHIDYSYKLLELFYHFKKYNYFLFLYRTYYHFTITLLIFLTDVCIISLALFLCIIFYYRLPFITTLIYYFLGSFFLFFLFFYSLKPVTGFADVINFKLKFKILIFNLNNAYLFIYLFMRVITSIMHHTYYYYNYHHYLFIFFFSGFHYSSKS